tara:strand:+ start:10376 stop:11515 length:1140 start_codon:yes stop_codon:yes gene_type:complete
MNKILESTKATLGLIKYNSLPLDKREITFYSEGKNYWPHIEGIMNKTLEKTNRSVCYVSSSLEDPGLLINHPNLKKIFIGMASTRDYFFQNLNTKLMVMTMPDLQNFQIKRSQHKVHYLYVQHSLVSLHAIYRHGAFDHYDTICAAGPHHVEEIKAIELKYGLSKKNIIKLGYSRLDNLIKAKNYYSLNSKKHDTKIILIAPSWGPNGIIESGLGKNLIHKLLGLGYKVILRPHPQTYKFAREKVNEIKNENQQNSLFTFEESISGQESLIKSDIMISDWSGVAIEYAFAFKKPIIFCDVPRKINNPNHQDIKIEPVEVSLREKIGVIWDGLSPIEKKLELCLQKETNLDSLIDKYCFNNGYSDEVFAKALVDTILPSS